MKTEELRGLSPEELNAKTGEWEEQIFRLRCEKKTGQLENTSQIPLFRKNIARAKTILNEKKHAAKQ